MKNFIFATIVAVYFVCLGCDKPEKSDPAPATTASSSDFDTGLETTFNSNGEIQLRSVCDSCNTCCCTLTVTAPITTPPTTVPVGFCSSAFPGCGSIGCGCYLGDATCGPNVPSGSNAANANLQPGVSGFDFKEWCSGDDSVPFVITNSDPTNTVGYRLDCGAGVITFNLTPGQSAFIKKTNCTPAVDCYY